MGPKKGSRSAASYGEPREVEFRTVLRLRPLLKKEREDPILLDPLPSDVATVVLHPPPSKQGDLLSPSSELVRQTVDPTVVSQDIDYRLDYVWPSETTQDKLYFSTGLPMALAAMEPLKVDHQGTSEGSRIDQLIVGLGVAGSGKTYSCWGGGTIHNKRKKESDGLVPRILDSFFSQSKHHICNKRGLYFAVNLSILLVKQHKHKPDDGAIHDLLQPVAARSFSISSVSTLSLSSAGRSPVIQNMKSVQAGQLVKHLTGSSNSNTNSSHYSSLEEPVFVEQDAEAEFHVVNGQVRACRTVEEAREALQVAMASVYRLSSKRHQSHVLVTMQPVLLDKMGTTILRSGGTLAVLDMAGYTSLPTQTNNRTKESLPAKFDAHSALFRCLRTIQDNEGLRSRTTPRNDDAAKNPTLQSIFSKDRRLSLRKVPFRQHKLTMLLQPLLSKKYSEKTVVTLLLTAYPGHRDYVEKKSLLNEVKPFRGSLLSCEAAAKTGLKIGSRKKDRSSKRKNANHKPSRVVMSSDADADDEGSVDETLKKVELSPMQVPTDYNSQNPVAVVPGISHYISSSYSDDPLDEYYRTEPLPPPVAPSYAMLMGASLSSSILSPEPSAPVELQPCAAPVIPGKDTFTAADFPGVRFPSSPAISVKSCTSEESVPPSPPTLAQAAVNVMIHRSEHEETEALDRAMFSPMKAFNKVVCASKKKGMQVIDKVSKLSYEKECDHVELAQRLKCLENEQKKVMEENDQLRNSNEKLKLENENLRSRLLKYEYEATEDLSDDNSHSQSGKWGTYHRERTTHNSLVDSSLMQHMAALGGYH